MPNEAMPMAMAAERLRLARSTVRGLVAAGRLRHEGYNRTESGKIVGLVNTADVEAMAAAREPQDEE